MDAVVYHSGQQQFYPSGGNEGGDGNVLHYSRWHYYNTGYNKWYYSYAEYTGSNYKPGTGNWEYMSSYEPLSKNGTADGHQRYENYWWNETVSYEQDSYEVTYYRYRDLQ